MREAIERVIQELTARAIVHEMQEIKTYEVGGSGYVINMVAKEAVAKEAYDFAANQLKAVIAEHETDNPHQSNGHGTHDSGNGQTDQVVSSGRPEGAEG